MNGHWISINFQFLMDSHVLGSPENDLSNLGNGFCMCDTNIEVTLAQQVHKISGNFIFSYNFAKSPIFGKTFEHCLHIKFRKK